MKEYITCKREFATLLEDKRPTYIAKVGRFVTLNATTFPDIVPPGPTLTTKATTLLSKLSAREDSKLAQDAYDLELTADFKMMELVYDYVDLISAGNTAIIALAGINGTSSNTTSIGVPAIPAGLKFDFATGVGEMILVRDLDKIARGSLTVTFTNTKITVVKSGNTQLKITCEDGSLIYLDIETAINLLIQNQVKATEIMSVMALFNANGLSPVASPPPIVVPR